MVEQLRTLLHDEADGLIVPPPDTTQILRAGRRQRRRLPVGAGLAAAASVALVVGGIQVLADTATYRPEVTQTFASSSTQDAYRRYGAFSVGSTVYLGSRKVRFEEKVKSLYYTSEGVLVRLGKDAQIEGGSPSRYVLVAPDGTTRGIPLDMDDRVPGTDPSSPYLTYAAPAEKGPLVERCVEGVMTLEDRVNAEPERECHQVHEPRRYHLVAVDLRTGEEAHRATYDGTFTWGGWAAPPVTTHGDAMWALFDEGWVEHDWKTGTTRPVPNARGPFEAAGGVYLSETPVEAPTGVRVGEEVRVNGVRVGRVTQVEPAGDGEVHVTFEADDGEEGPAQGATVRDFRTGETLLEVPPAVNPVFSLSPTGETVRVEGYTSYGEDNELLDPPGPSRFVHLGTGKVVPIPGDRLLGWTPEGNALAVDTRADRISVCDAVTGACEDLDIEIPEGTVKLGGKSYES